MIDLENRIKITDIFAKKCIASEKNLIPSDDAIWIRHNSSLGFLELDVEVPYNDIFDEINNIKNMFTNHRTHDSKGWSSFTVYGKQYNKPGWDDEDTTPSIWTPESFDLLPKTVEFFQNHWPCFKYTRLRIMRLAPGGYITLHRDDPAPGQLSPVNIAINNPIGCNFYMENEGIIPFTSGKAIMLNVCRLHAVINNSNEDRYHIISHQDWESLNPIVVRSYHKLLKSKIK